MEKDMRRPVVVAVGGSGSGRAAIQLAARATDAQLIVLASGLSTSILAGAVSQYVVRNAPCPVLVVPDGRGQG